MTHDDTRFREVGGELRAAILETLPAWIDDVMSEFLPADVDPDRTQAVRSQVLEAAATSLGRMVSADLDEPVSGPLEQVRQAAGPLQSWVTEHHGVAVEIGPMAFTDLSPDVHEFGIAWGAAKAYLHLQRRNPTMPDGCD
ncbi:MAG: hypothetical protein ACR2P0_12540 [Acidimicrobiales bacterium]